MTQLRLETNLLFPAILNNQIYYMSSLGRSNMKDSVCRMMKRLRTKRIWSEYSLKGRKGKNAFKDLVICRDFIKACLKNNVKTKEIEIEKAISETFKYALNQRGGVKYKVPEQKKKEIVHEETNSDC